MAVLWLRFLTEINEDTDKVPEELLENEEISKALSIVEKSAMTESQLYAYERFWDAVNREHILSESKYKEGKEAGLAEGMEKGLTEGKQKIARNLKDMHFSIDNIVKATGLSAEEIEML